MWLPLNSGIKGNEIANQAEATITNQNQRKEKTKGSRRTQ